MKWHLTLTSARYFPLEVARTLVKLCTVKIIDDVILEIECKVVSVKPGAMDGIDIGTD